MARRPLGWPGALAICVIWVVNGGVIALFARELPPNWTVLGALITSWAAGVISNSIARPDRSDDSRV